MVLRVFQGVEGKRVVIYIDEKGVVDREFLKIIIQYMIRDNKYLLFIKLDVFFLFIFKKGKEEIILLV